MARILISLFILLFLPPRIAIAESEEFDSGRACDYIEASSSSELGSSVPELTQAQTIQDPINRSTEAADAPEAKQKVNSSPQTPPTSTDKSQLPDESKIALAGISIPSLWWAREQFDPFGGKLISNWLTKPRAKQIDLVVNWQLWRLLDYLGRYRFINQFGTVAREHGYDLRIFNQQKQCLALYEYNQVTNPPKWEIKIEGLGQESLQVIPNIN